MCPPAGRLASPHDPRPAQHTACRRKHAAHPERGDVQVAISHPHIVRAVSISLRQRQQSSTPSSAGDRGNSERQQAGPQQLRSPSRSLRHAAPPLRCCPTPTPRCPGRSSTCLCPRYHHQTHPTCRPHHTQQVGHGAARSWAPGERQRGAGADSAAADRHTHQIAWLPGGTSKGAGLGGTGRGPGWQHGHGHGHGLKRVC